jgi:hypothetical protein
MSGITSRRICLAVKNHTPPITTIWVITATQGRGVRFFAAIPSTSIRGRIDVKRDGRDRDGRCAGIP